MKYSKTYAGLLVILAGIVGIGDLLSPEKAETYVTVAIEIIGIIIAAIGRYKAGGVSILGVK